MKMKRGSSSKRRYIFIGDSSSTVGAGLANLAWNTASLVAYYIAGDLSDEIQITLATATLGTWTSGGFVAVDNTNMPGWYEIGIPNASLDGGDEAAIQFRGAANMVPVNLYIELDAVDYQDAVRLGLTALPAAAAAGNGGLPILSSSGTTLAYTVSTVASVTAFSAAAIQSVWDALNSALTTVGSIGKALVTLVTDYTTARAAKIDEITAARMGALTDWVDGGRLDLILDARASSTEVTAIQNNTRTVIVAPAVIERPDSGTDTYLIHIYLYDEVGNMEAPDSAPTVALTNSAGTDRSSRLGSTTGTLVGTGHYKWVYTNTSSDTLEQLLWEFSVIEGGLTRLFGRDTLLVDTTAVDFTSSDRTVLNAAATAVALAAAKADTAAILIDTAELQTDLTNGGRLDLLIDAILADTDSLDTTKITTARAGYLDNLSAGAVALQGTLSTVSTNVSTLVTKLTTGITSLAQWLGLLAGKQTPNSTALTEINATGAGSGGYLASSDSLEAIRDRGDAAWITGSSGGGTGARSVTITVNDGATALQNATVRMTQGAESYAVLTNVSGVAVFALDDATWTVTVTKAGYTFTPTTIIVNGTETATYSMTLVTITPSDPGETTGYVTIRTLAGVEVSGAVVDVEVTRWANGTTGSGITPRMRSRTTDVNGYAEFTGLPRLATYRVRVDDGEWASSAVTLDAATTPLTAPIGPAE